MHLFLISLALIEYVLCAQYIGDFCTIQATSGTGQCTLLSDCPSALNDLQKFQKFPQTCGFAGTQPIVCCPQSSSTTSTTSTTSRYTTESVFINKNRNPGEISRLKCREYGKYVYSKKRPPILLIDAEESERKECGFTVVELIVGGELSKRKEFPHMAAIGYEIRAGDISWACGGSLISEQYVLTAGHCLISRELGESKYVKVGVTNLYDSNNAQQLDIIQRIKYPEYKPSSHYNDLGLLKLSKFVTLNPYARPACLFIKSEISEKKGVASGWGKTAYAGETSNDLLKVTLDFIPINECNNSYRSQIGRKLRNGIMPESQICAGSKDPEKEKDTCQGDSGGPLQVYHPTKDVDCMYDIVGVTSFGKACGIGTSPGIYTKVSKYIKWIEDIVWP